MAIVDNRSTILIILLRPKMRELKIRAFRSSTVKSRIRFGISFIYLGNRLENNFSKIFYNAVISSLLVAKKDSETMLSDLRLWSTSPEFRYEVAYVT